MNTMLRFFAITFFCITAMMSYGQYVFAATISFKPSSTQLTASDEMYVDVYLDTEGESVNAVRLSVVLPKDFEFTYVNESASIIPLWVESPKKTEDGSVVFSGIIPGGFGGYIDPFDVKNRAPGIIARIYGIPQKTGDMTISARDAEIYRNDGTGARIVTTITPLSLNVQKSTGGNTSRISDTEQPLPFTPAIVSDPLLHDGLAVVVFTTKDTGSGIAYYEVRENSEQWKKAVSPYVLENQKNLSFVEVRAVDRAGNQRLARVEIPEYLQRTQISMVWIGIGIALLISCAILIVKWQHIVSFMRKK